mgnify:CR=1 FL=1
MKIDQQVINYQLVLWLLYNLCTVVGYIIHDHDWNLALMVSTLLILPVSYIRYGVDWVPEIMGKSVWVTLTTVVLLLFGVGIYLEPLDGESAFAIKLGAGFYALAVFFPQWQQLKQNAQNKSPSNAVYFQAFLYVTFILTMGSIIYIFSGGHLDPWIVALPIVYGLAFLCTMLYYSSPQQNPYFGSLCVVLYMASVLLYGAYLGYDTERPDTPENVEDFGFAGAAVLCFSILGMHVWGDIFAVQPETKSGGPILRGEKDSRLDLNVRSLVF